MDNKYKYMRESNFELIRIIAMLFIVAHHLAAHGVINMTNTERAYVLWNNGSTANKLFSSGLISGGCIGIALFAMLSGYFLIYNNRISLKKITCEAVYYGIFCAMLFAISWLAGYRFDDVQSLKTLLKYAVGNVIIPISKGNWWFVTVYVLLILLHPLINNVILKQNKKGNLITVLLVWSIYTLGTFLDTTFYFLHELVLFYIIGACLKKYDIVKGVTNKEMNKIFLFIALILSILLYTVLTCIGCQMSTDLAVDKIISKAITFVCTCVIVPFSAFAIFALFGSMRFKNNTFINRIAVTTLGVYFIHDSVVARSVIWHGILKVNRLYMSEFFPFYSVIGIISVFAICSAMDLIRLYFFEPKMLSACNIISDQFRKKFCDVKER